MCRDGILGCIRGELLVIMITVRVGRLKMMGAGTRQLGAPSPKLVSPCRGPNAMQYGGVLNGTVKDDILRVRVSISNLL
jgi:hypothetical protein